LTVSQFPQRQIPDPPRPLGPDGTRFWNRVWTMPAGWIDQTFDLEHIAILAESFDERGILRLEVFQTGDRLARVALRNLDASIVAMIGALGLNPVDRKTLSVGGGGSADSKLAKFRRDLHNGRAAGN
jgi:hypothetical protein